MGAESRIISSTNADELADWCGGRVVIQQDPENDNSTVPGINVPTVNGVKRAQVGDMLMRDHTGAFRIIKREKF